MEIYSQFHVHVAFIHRQAVPTDRTVTRKFPVLSKSNRDNLDPDICDYLLSYPDAFLPLSQRGQSSISLAFASLLAQAILLYK